jgi:hypothetical protein
MVWVVVGVGVSVGNGEREGEFVGVKVAVKEAVGTRVGAAVISALQPEITNSKGSMIQVKNHFLEGDINFIVFLLPKRGPANKSSGSNHRKLLI